MGAFEARKDRWALLLDAVYLKLSDKGGVTGPLGFSSIDGQAEVTQQLYALAGAYRVTEGTRAVDVVGGLRYNSVKWDVNITASVPVVPVGARRFAETKRWVDPYLGVRLRQPMSERWSLGAYADVGGFGLGSGLSWQAIVGADYAFTPRVSGKIGYRHVYNDYDDDGFTFDVASSGIYAGVGLRW